MKGLHYRRATYLLTTGVILALLGVITAFVMLWLQSHRIAGQADRIASQSDALCGVSQRVITYLQGSARRVQKSKVVSPSGKLEAKRQVDALIVAFQLSNCPTKTKPSAKQRARS